MTMHGGADFTDDRLRDRHRVTVIGAGVIGLSVAHELAAAGDAVTVVADASAEDSVSSVAGGLWFPYRVDAVEGSARIMERSLARFTALLDRPEAAVNLREGTVVERVADPDRSWARAAAWSRPARADELPVGAPGGVRTALPVVDTPKYLAWLGRACRALGVRVELETVRELEETVASTRADALVVAAGLRSGALLGDDSGYPIRGQVVLLRNPGLRDWLLDDDHPDGLTYVLPRGEDVVCGGTADDGETDTTVDPGVETAILRRVTAAVPALRGHELLGSRVGLRPARPTLRIEAVAGWSVPVIACYGHGGAGISLSWGSAERVAELVRA